MSQQPYPGARAREERGWLLANRWLLARRFSQLGILILFLLGPLGGIWLVTGNLNSSLTLGVLPLSDPYVLLQSFFAGHQLVSTALVGAVIVVGFYLLVGGRAYCSWVCPVNMVTDAAAMLRQRLGIKGGGTRLRRVTRYWILAMTLLVSLASGTIAWEFVNPVSMFHRGLIFGIGLAWTIIAAVFLLDLFVSRYAWCGHLCPVGAFYSLLGKYSLVRVSAAARDRCDDCMDCFQICPEPQVIPPALRGAEKGVGPVILSPNCTNCGRCIDVCSKNVFGFSTRFNNSTPGGVMSRTEVAS
ncbi:MAG: quinol dehydrogenase [Acidithiobacillales bacterium SG8_45]|nr:MAG: quinol dehydrogenase [Acidithiobacillales bacterium SG8_45]